jgi:hypothetical protein
MDYRRPFYRIETLVSRPILKNIIMRAGGSISLLDSDERPEVDIVAFGQRYSREQNVCVYRDKCWEEALGQESGKNGSNFDNHRSRRK